MSFTGYKGNVIQLIQDLDDIQGYCTDLNMDGAAEAASAMSDRLKADEFNVAVVGEFNRGKSTLINALLEKRVLPDGIRPTTAVVNKVKYGITPSASIEYRDGRTEEIPVEELKNYITKLTEEGEERAKTIKEAIVYYPLNYCKNGVTLIDTPGLNDDETMTEVTLSILAEADAAIMVMFGSATFSDTERRFLEDHLLAGDIGRVLFVVTAMDNYDEEEQKEILDSCRERITRYVLEKAKKVYGADSEEYQDRRRKLGQLQIYGLSARNAVRAKEKGDQRMLEESNFPAFEEGLERFLTEERGAITLSVPVRRIKSTAVELYQAVRLRENALQMEIDDFNQKYQSAMAEMKRLRAERARELAKVTDAANAVYDGLGGQISGYWPALRGAALEAVDNYPIAKDDLKTKEGQTALQQSMTNAVKQAMSSEAQVQMERIQNYINQGLAREAERISAFEEEFQTSIEGIQDMFVPEVSAEKESDAAMTAGGIVANYFTFGIGSAIDGYRQAGWKGALLGGLGGGAVTAGSGIGLLLLIGTLVPLTTPVVIVAGAVSAVAGMFGGRKILNSVLGVNLDTFRQNFKDALTKQLDEMALSQDISGAVRDQVVTMFDSLKQKVTDESERILTDMQNQLDGLKIEVSNRMVLSGKEKEKFRVMIENLDEITIRAASLEQQLNAVLEKAAA